MDENPRIAIIGTGNAGTYLGKALQTRFRVEVFGRSGPGASPVNSLNSSDFDLVLLCVSDDAISEVSNLISPTNAIVAHVSGATALSSISAKHKRRAVFYPLMSLKKDAKIDPATIPFCLEAEQAGDLRILENIVKKMGAKAYLLNSDQRPYLHLAAVLTHNFSNHLYHLADDLLQKQQIDFKILLPLLRKSLEMLEEKRPYKLQTGPALRHDEATLARHNQLLEDPQTKKIYQLLTQSIQQTHD